MLPGRGAYNRTRPAKGKVNRDGLRGETGGPGEGGTAMPGARIGAGIGGGAGQIRH